MRTCFLWMVAALAIVFFCSPSVEAGGCRANVRQAQQAYQAAPVAAFLAPQAVILQPAQAVVATTYQPVQLQQVQYQYAAPIVQQQKIVEKIVERERVVERRPRVVRQFSRTVTRE